MGGGENRGGFAERFRGSGNLAVKIPDNMSPADAAPLLCAGITVWSPIRKYVTKPGMKVRQLAKITLWLQVRIHIRRNLSPGLVQR